MLISLSSCICDPPLKGKDIFIENQTNDYVFVTDSLQGSQYFTIYDTFLLNGKIYISSLPNYIPKFNKWQSFLSEIEFSDMKSRGNSQSTYYFIKKENILFSIEQIRSKKLYDSINISLEEIVKNNLNYIMYYGDSIIFNHEFSISRNRL